MKFMRDKYINFYNDLVNFLYIIDSKINNDNLLHPYYFCREELSKFSKEGHKLLHKIQSKL